MNRASSLSRFQIEMLDEYLISEQSVRRLNIEQIREKFTRTPHVIHSHFQRPYFYLIGWNEHLLSSSQALSA